MFTIVTISSFVCSFNEIRCLIVLGCAMTALAYIMIAIMFYVIHVPVVLAIAAGRQSALLIKTLRCPGP